MYEMEAAEIRDRIVSLCREPMDTGKRVAQLVCCDIEFVAVLDVEPELCAVAECLASRSAVSAVIERFPCTISLIRRGGTPMVVARRFWVMPSGSRKSSRRISPGWMGLRSAVMVAIPCRFCVAGAECRFLSDCQW
ncbi:hypothetical protein NJ76_27900 [Rhodococcus sp. IITR03]|nr:hypothetical protein NJ76_27900 [Rhodococcus sp. IITR03]